MTAHTGEPKLEPCELADALKPLTCGLCAGRGTTPRQKFSGPGTHDATCPICKGRGKVTQELSLEQAQAASDALRAAGWREIDEKTPLDVPLLLGWWGHTGLHTLPEWRYEAGVAGMSNRCPPKSGASNGWLHSHATHWQPLPAPPQDMKEKE